MASAAYRLLGRNGLEPLEAHGWLHALQTRQIVIPDYNEQGPQGPLLGLMLSASRPKWAPWKNSEESNSFHPDPPHEELVVWAIENGADPWVRHQGANAWTEAIYRGWPRVMKYLAEHPQAPSKEELEKESIPSFMMHSSNQDFKAPVAFAYRNQLEALQAWSDLGLSVNLGVGTHQSPGVRARTPEFLALWAKLGGDITSTLPDGRPIKSAWPSSNASWQVAMEREWLRHQPKQDRPIDERMAEAVECAQALTSKTLFIHRLKELEVSVSAPGSDGRVLWEVWWDQAQDPQGRGVASTAASVADFLLKAAPDEVVWEALVDGLRRSGAYLRPKHFPSSVQLKDLILGGRFGTPSQTLRDLATRVAKHPHAMNRLIDSSSGFTQCLELTGTPRYALADPESPTYQERDLALANFWGEWFFTPSEECPAGQGWISISRWAQEESPRDDSSLVYRVYQKIMSPENELTQRRAGAELLGALELVRQRTLDYALKPENLDKWDAGQLSGWAEGLAVLAPSFPSVPDQIVDLVWDRLEEDCRTSQESLSVLDQIRSRVAQSRLERGLPGEGASPPSRRIRF